MMNAGSSSRCSVVRLRRGRWRRARSPTRSMRRIGVLMNAAATETVPQSYVAAFVQGLRQLGWTEGQNFRIDVRWNAGDAQLARIYAAQLIGLMPDVILTASTTNLTIFQQATSTVPVVFVQVSDPVEQGFVASEAKPGGNLTGFSLFEFSIGGKWLNLLKEIAPGLAHVGVVFNPDTSPQSKFFMRSVEAAASSLDVRAMVVPVHSSADIEPALESFAQQSNGGLILPTDSFTGLRSELIVDLATAIGCRRSARPGIPERRRPDVLRRDHQLARAISAGGHLRRPHSQGREARRSAGPAGRQVYAVINLKTAKALGLTCRPLLGLADEVIE